MCESLIETRVLCKNNLKNSDKLDMPKSNFRNEDFIDYPNRPFYPAQFHCSISCVNKI